MRESVMALAYFCCAIIVLFFRRLCSKPPEYSLKHGRYEGWWFYTLVLMVLWPILAPLCGAYVLGAKASSLFEEEGK